MKTARKAIVPNKGIFKENEVVITHGNGPQVGNLLLQQESNDEVPSMPLDVLVAMSQGEIGYFINSALSEIGQHSATLVTRVVIDKDDPALEKPSKPVGPFYDKPVRKGMKMDAGRGYRLVVPSPTPAKIREADAIGALLERGFTVIAVGGGGIPITEDGKGIEAVIDKDRASALLANDINAEHLVIVTSVDSVFLNFGEENEQEIEKMSISEAEQYIEEGHFAKGSMLPKIESCISFIRNGGKKAIICGIRNMKEAIDGNAGTVIE
jgi:carbamate kinase